MTEPEIIEDVFDEAPEESVPLDPYGLVERLQTETQLSLETARAVAEAVVAQLEQNPTLPRTPALLHALTEAQLQAANLTDAQRLHAQLGVSFASVDQLIQAAPVGEQNFHSAAHGPDGTSLALAEQIKREYAMLAVFSETVAMAHRAGRLHIEKLGEMDRPVTMIGSMDFIKRFGVRLPSGFAGARPARRPEVLAAHLVKHTAALHGYFSEAIAWDSVNFAIAPLLVGLNQREMRQIAQVLLFELSAPAVARGGQLVRCDLHLDWDCPAYLREVPALGAGGEKLTTTYMQFVTVARDFLKAFLEVYLEGDGQKLPFTGPRPILHLSRESIASPGYRGFLDLVVHAMAERGGIAIAFEREAQANAFTTRYGVSAERLQRRPESWQWRAAIFSAVAINLPRLAYEANGDEHEVLNRLPALLELAAQASLEKRVFLEKLLARGEAGALGLLAMRHEQDAFLPLGWATHAIAPVGLAELTQAVTGVSLGMSPRAQAFAARVLTALRAETERLADKHKVRFLIAESHDLTAPHRFARLDLHAYDHRTLNELNEAAGDEAEIFYTNAIKLPVNSRANLLERLRIEGQLQAGHVWGTTSDVWLNPNAPNYERLVTLLSVAVHQTEVAALTLAPDFTICLSCAACTRGIHPACSACGATRVEGLAQASNRYSHTSTWPRWKLAELRQRRRDEL
jgi:ribonucleoside-triphosphate reductase